MHTGAFFSPVYFSVTRQTFSPLPALSTFGVEAFCAGAFAFSSYAPLRSLLPIALIAGVAAASAGFLVFVLGALAKSRRRAVVTGREQMIGAPGEALEDFEREGWVHVRGERWKARSRGPLRRGQKLRVTGMHGLVLEVNPEGE